MPRRQPSGRPRRAWWRFAPAEKDGTEEGEDARWRFLAPGGGGAYVSAILRWRAFMNRCSCRGSSGAPSRASTRRWTSATVRPAKPTPSSANTAWTARVMRPMTLSLDVLSLQSLTRRLSATEIPKLYPGESEKYPSPARPCHPAHLNLHLLTTPLPESAGRGGTPPGHAPLCQ